MTTSGCRTSAPATCCASTGRTSTELGQQGQGVHGQRRPRARRAGDRDDPRARSRTRATTASCSTASRARSARPTRWPRRWSKLGRRLTAALLVEAPDESCCSGSPAGARAPTATSTTSSSTRPSTTASATRTASRWSSATTTSRRRSRKRLGVYHQTTEPLIDYYDERGLLRRFDGTRSDDRGPRPHPRDARDAAPRGTAVIIKKSPAEIDQMAAAGEILVRTMDLLAGKIRPGVTTQGAGRGGGEVHPLAGRDAGVQGLPRLPGLDLRLAERHGRPRHPGRVQALARRHPLRGHRRREGRLGGRRRPHVRRSATSRRWRRKLLEVTEGALFAAVEQCRAGQPARRRLPRGPGARGGRRASRSCARWSATASGATCTRSRRSRTTAPPGKGVAARGGHGAGGRADGHRRPPHGPHGRRRLGDLLPGRLAGRALRVHDRDHRRRPARSSRRGTTPRPPAGSLHQQQHRPAAPLRRRPPSRRSRASSHSTSRASQAAWQALRVGGDAVGSQRAGLEGRAAGRVLLRREPGVDAPGRRRSSSAGSGRDRDQARRRCRGVGMRSRVPRQVGRRASRGRRRRSGARTSQATAALGARVLGVDGSKAARRRGTGPFPVPRVAAGADDPRSWSCTRRRASTGARCRRWPGCVAVGGRAGVGGSRDGGRVSGAEVSGKRSAESWTTTGVKAASRAETAVGEHPDASTRVRRLAGGPVGTLALLSCAVALGAGRLLRVTAPGAW